LAIGIAVARRKPAAQPDPQDAVYAMPLSAGRAAENPTFGKYLQDSVAGVKGIVVSDPQPSPTNKCK
jgi:hypothetical protein